MMMMMIWKINFIHSIAFLFWFCLSNVDFTQMFIKIISTNNGESKTNDTVK